jgi:hypothetical protein
LDWQALLHYIAYLYRKRKLGLTYHQALEGDRDIRKTVACLYLKRHEKTHNTDKLSVTVCITVKQRI